MQQNLMAWINNSSLSWLTSHHSSSSLPKVFWWRKTAESKSPTLNSVSLSVSLLFGCWEDQTLAQNDQSVVLKTIYIFLVGAQFVLTNLCMVIVLKVYAFALKFTSAPPPFSHFLDKLHEVQKTIVSWNYHTHKSSYCLEYPDYMNLCPQIWIN